MAVVLVQNGAHLSPKSHLMHDEVRGSIETRRASLATLFRWMIQCLSPRSFWGLTHANMKRHQRPNSAWRVFDRPGTNLSCHRDAIRDSRIATTSPPNCCGAVRHEWLSRLRFAQNRGAKLRPCSHSYRVRFEICNFQRPPHFARDYFARATLAVFVETHRLRTLMPNVITECPKSHVEMLYGNHVYHQSPRPALNLILAVIRYALRFARRVS